MPARQPILSPEGFSNFGDLLRYLRQRVHLSQRELAALVGFHFSYISYLEKNTRRVDEATLLGRFVPALALEEEPEWTARLLELSKHKQDESPIHRISESTISKERSDSLPPNFVSIIGREKESNQLQKLILDSNYRLISLLGPPGVGKTCLALHVVRLGSATFKDGVVFVDLAPVRTASMLFTTIAQTLNVAEENLNSALSDKELLLVLDNFEQIVDAAPELLKMLQAAPHLKILVTSREVLRLRGEQEFYLSPLPLPSEHISVEQLKDIASVKLFVERAQAVHPAFKLDETNASQVAEICSRLDGLPLAIELAAARTRALSLATMLEQLHHRFEWLTQGTRDLPTWRQTLQGTLEWSVNLLSKEELSLFQRLSIFTGGWTLEAALDVCSNDVIFKRTELFNLLIQLIEKSLVLPEDANGRFNFLETLREYAMIGLRESGEQESIREKHYIYFLKFIETANPHFKQGAEQFSWLKRADAEHNNLRQALAWVVEKPERAETAMNFGVAIHMFWLMHSYLNEARMWLAKILALDSTPRLTRANLLRYSADYVSSQGDFAQAQVFEEEAMNISKSLGDEAGVYYSMDGIAMRAGMLGDYAQAIELLKQILEYRRRMKDLVLLTITLNNLALATKLSGDLVGAVPLYEEAIALTREEKDAYSLSRALSGLANVYVLQKNYSLAAPLLLESMLWRYQLGEQKGISSSMESISEFVAALGDYRFAAILQSAAARIRRDINFPIAPGIRQENEDFLLKLKNNLGEKDFATTWHDGETFSQDQIVEMIKASPLLNGEANS